MWIEIRSAGGTSCLLGNYYLPAIPDKAVFNDYIDMLESVITASDSRVHIYCGFNLPGVERQSGTVDCSDTPTRLRAFRLLDFAQLNDFAQCNNILNSASNVFDLVPLNDQCPKVNAACAALLRVDKYHPPIELLVSLSFPSAQTNSCPSFRYNRGDSYGLQRYYDDLDWSPVTKLSDVDTATERFTKTVLDGILMFVPVGTVKSSKFPFWFSPELRRNCNIKLNYHRRYKLTVLKYRYLKYSVCRSLVKKLSAR